MEALLSRLGEIESLVTQKKILSKALREGSILIQEEAEHRAPVETGRLAASMMTTITEATATEAIAKIGPSRKGFYGSFNELGTAHQPAKPFLRPAYDAKIDEALAVIGYFLAKGIENE